MNNVKTANSLVEDNEDKVDTECIKIKDNIDNAEKEYIRTNDKADDDETVIGGQVNCNFENLPKRTKNKPARLRDFIDSPFQRERKQEINFTDTVRGVHTLSPKCAYQHPE